MLCSFPDKYNGRKEELERTNYSENAVDHFLGVCAGWLIGHTLMEDRAITGEGMSKWVDLLPEEELEAMMVEAELFLDEGYMFGDEGIGFERVNLAVPRDVLMKALERLERAVKG